MEEKFTLRSHLLSYLHKIFNWEPKEKVSSHTSSAAWEELSIIIECTKERISGVGKDSKGKVTNTDNINSSLKNTVGGTRTRCQLRTNG